MFSMSRKVIRAVSPGVKGKGVNLHWCKTVEVKSLKLATCLSMVTGRSTFSLDQFLPWEKMKLRDYNAGPDAQDFLIPVKSWEYFQVNSYM